MCIGWIFFKAESVGQAIEIMRRIVTGADGIHHIYSYTVIYGLLIVVCYLYGVWKNRGEGRYLVLKLEKFWSKVAVCVVLGLIMVFAYQGRQCVC